MRIASAERKIESTFQGKKKKFRFEASAKAFQIVSSNLYTDKPLAILRELSCNALDSHRDAGTLDKPFEIDLPTKLNPTLRIRDYGTGMSNSKIEGLYSTVFASDKNDNDEDIGGLGLGSKTPFSYADTFTLISYLNGRKTVWLCFIDDDGEPAVQRAESGITDEANGIEYLIPIKFEDFNSFKEKVPVALQYFPPESYKTLVSVTPIEYKIKNDVYGIRDKNSTGNSGPRVLMGPVAYRLDKSAFDYEDQKKYAMILDHNFDIFCEIGAVDFQASREALSYDVKSKKSILNILKKVQNVLMVDIKDEIKAAPTYLEACVKARTLMADFHYSHREGMEWKGKNVFPDTSMNLRGEAALVSIHDITAADQLRPGFSKHLYLTLDHILKEPVFIHFDQTCKVNNVRIKHFLREEASGKPLLLFRDEQDMYEVMEQYQIFDCLSTYDLPVPEKVKNEKGDVVSKAPVKIKYVKPGRTTFHETSMTIEEINETEDACWAPLFGSGDTPWKEDNHRTLHNYCVGRLAISYTVFGVPQTLRHKAKHIVLPDIETFLRGKLIELLDYDEIMAASESNKLDWGGKVHNNYPDEFKHLPLWTELDKHYCDKTKFIREHRDRIEQMMGWKFPTFDKVTSKLDDLLAGKYNVLRHCDNMYYSGSDKFIREVMHLLHPNQGVKK